VIVPTRLRLTAFGASRIDTSDPRYGDVRELARKLAEAGWDGITGGHQGMMAAFSEGIHSGGGHIRGITLERFPTPPNNTLSEEVRARDFFHRMQRLIDEADAYLVLPGGLGTLAELAMTWDLLAIRVLESRPLRVYGEMWESIATALRSELVWSVEEAFDLACFCKSHEEVLAQLARTQ